MPTVNQSDITIIHKDAEQPETIFIVKMLLVYLLEVTVGEELARNGHGFDPSWVQKTTEVEYKVIKYDLQVTGISYLLVTKYSSSGVN